MLKEKIDDFYSKPEEEKERKNFWISEADTCPRAVFYAFKNMPKAKRDAQSYRILEHGEFTHIRLMRALFGMGIVRATEIKIPEDQVFRGRADAIITLDNESYVLEIKTMNKGAFQFSSAPQKAHYRQIQLYMHYFNITKGIILIENKDTQELKEFLIEKDEQEIKKIFEEFEILKKQIATDEVPMKPIDLEEWKCRYCPYDFCEFFLGRNNASPLSQQKLPV